LYFFFIKVQVINQLYIFPAGAEICHILLLWDFKSIFINILKIIKFQAIWAVLIKRDFSRYLRFTPERVSGFLLELLSGECF